MNRTLKKLLICTGILAFTISGCSSNKTTKEENKEEEKLTLIKNDLYLEPLNPSNTQIKAFNKLSQAVTSQNYEEEGKMTAVNFALDFFTLANKSSAEDVGGLQYIPTSKVYRFKEYAQAYYYNNYGEIVNEYGKKSLPEVTSYKVDSITAGSYSLNDRPCEGYEVKLTLKYGDTDLPAKKMKKTMTIVVVDISDYPYDREKVYKEEADFTGDRINAYRVLSLND